VIVETPCYESALQVARSTGAQVSEWERRYEDGWAHDLDALAGMIARRTRLLYINQPHNPTGTLMARRVFEDVIGRARAHAARPVQRRVYRELEYNPPNRLPAACDMYERAVFARQHLQELRPARAADRLDRYPRASIREAVSTLKDYTTICAERAERVLTALALRNRKVLLDRNLGIVRRNLPLLDAFFERHAETFQWTRPTASPIAFPASRAIDNLARYCARLAEIGVLLLPARSTISQTTSGSASVGLTCARLWNSSRLTSPAAIDAATHATAPPLRGCGTGTPSQLPSSSKSFSTTRNSSSAIFAWRWLSRVRWPASLMMICNTPASVGFILVW